ncbi:MAG: ABC transporter permease, partial [Candidatus Hodarchaeota archaeon]
MIATSGVISGFIAEIFGITEKAGDSPSIFIQSKDVNVGLSPEILTFLNHTNIEHVLPIAERNVRLSSMDASFDSKILGVNISQLMSYYSNAAIYAGRSPKSNESIPECLSGKNLHPLIGSSEINYTDAHFGTEQQLHIVGFIQNVQELQNVILIELQDYTTIFNHDLAPKFQKIKIRLKNAHFAEKTISDLKVMLKGYSHSITIKAEQQTDVFTDNLFSDIMIQLSLLFGVLFIIALIRVFHAISWFVKKYERDLLIMRAMGLSFKQIIFLVLLLAEIIGNSGFIMGFIFGFLIPPLLFTLLSVFFIGGFLVPEYDITIIFLLLFFSNLISMGAALYPAISIARKEPSTLTLSTHGIER